MSHVLYSFYIVGNCFFSNGLAATFTYFVLSLAPNDLNVLLTLNLYPIWTINAIAILYTCLYLWRLWISYFNLIVALVVTAIAYVDIHLTLCLFVALTLVKLRLVIASSFDGIHSQDPFELAGRIFKMLLWLVLPVDIGLNGIYLICRTPSAHLVHNLMGDTRTISVPGLLIMVNIIYATVLLATLIYARVLIRRHLRFQRQNRAIIVAELLNQQPREDNTSSILSYTALSLVTVLVFGLIFVNNVFGGKEHDADNVSLANILIPAGTNIMMMSLVFSPKLLAFLKLRYSQNRLPLVSSIVSMFRQPELN